MRETRKKKRDGTYYPSFNQRPRAGQGIREVPQRKDQNVYGKHNRDARIGSQGEKETRSDNDLKVFVRITLHSMMLFT